MDSTEITLWVDNRWAKALERQHGTSVSELLEEHLDTLVNQLPESEYKRISAEIWEEDQQAKRNIEASRRFAVFHVTENNASTYFVAEENMDMLVAANRLRKYIREPGEAAPDRFTGMFSKGERISCEQFDAYVAERLENAGRVTGAFDIDFDGGTFDSLHIMNGWQRFNIKDVSTAAYFAMKKYGENWDYRSKVFLDRLNGKQINQVTLPGFISGERRLCEGDISFSDEIVQQGNLLEFYLGESMDDAEKVFGSQVCPSSPDDSLNIYANYDMETHQVCDSLELYFKHGDGREQEFKYALTEEEKGLLLSKMEEYCLQTWGQGLDVCSTEYLTEQEQSDQGMQL